MAWTGGSPVLVTDGESIGAWSVAYGDTSTEGEINHPLDGRPMRVRGKFRVTDAGVTGVAFGLETQPVDRLTTNTTTYDLTLGAVNAWTEFSGWITPPSDQVWGRPYIAVTGSAGTADFVELHVERSPTGLVAAADIHPGAVSNGWPTRLSSSVSIANANYDELFYETVDLQGGPLEIKCNFEVTISSGSPLYIIICIDETYGGENPPSGHRKVVKITTGTSSTIRTVIPVLEPVGDPKDPTGDPLLTAGTHTIQVSALNETNQGVVFEAGTLSIREYPNDIVTP